MSLKKTFVKLTQWEHWPTAMFYIPILPYYLFKAIKARSLTFFLITNPSIRYSGDGTESKYKTIMMVPKKFRPKTILIKKFEKIKTINLAIKNEGITYPFIAKPNIGFRGLLVKKINTEEELNIYLEKNNSLEILIQEYLTHKNECGILYYRLPNEENGKINSITLKKFLSVTGDGKSTLTELILEDQRAYLYLDLLKNIHQDNLNNIPKNKENIVLTVIGNHSKGTQFINGNHLINKELTNSFDKLNKDIGNWYFGRLDIKYNDFEDLKKGRDYKVIEINGIIAEPTHIYDAQIKGATYFKALKTIKENWRIINDIALQNKENYNLPYPKV